MCTPITASAKGNEPVKNVDTFINETQKNGMDTKIVESVPNNVIPKEFETWEEALVWIKQLDVEIENENQNNKATFSTNSTPGLLHDGFEMIGQYGSCGYTSMPSYSGSTSKYNSYNIPGASAQTVNAAYYFLFSNSVITSSSASASISGVGLATYDVTYNALEQYGPFYAPNFYRIIRGTMGYYLNIGGVNIGYYKSLELDYCLWNTSGEIS